MINKLREIIKASDNIVFFGGAGVSTESGIPDFRSVDGLYNQKYKYPPEVILSKAFFWKNTKEFYEFYKEKMICIDAMPNKAHLYLTKLENQGKLKGIITQNIDGLHQKAKSKNVLELHGSVYRNYCVSCEKSYGIETIINSYDVPLCSCENLIKPDVVLYEEGLNDDVVRNAVSLIRGADVLIIGGTSLTVYPAAGLIDYFNGKHLIIINKSNTKAESIASLVINESIASVFENLE